MLGCSEQVDAQGYHHHDAHDVNVQDVDGVDDGGDDDVGGTMRLGQMANQFFWKAFF